MHIILVGTKAQLVKMAPVLIELRNREIAHKFVLTGQHSETVDDLITGFCLSSPDDILVPNHEADSKQKLLCWAHCSAGREKFLLFISRPASARLIF